MRMLDAEREQSIRVLQLYLTTKEATELIGSLTELLQQPEAAEHAHVLGDGRDLSFSIVTENKLRAGGYTALERRVLAEK